MKILVSFESFLLNNELDMRILLNKIRNMLPFLEYCSFDAIPYSSRAMFLLKKYYEKSRVTLVVEDKKNFIYALMAQNEINDSQLLKIEDCIFQKNMEEIKDYTYLSGSVIKDFDLLINANEYGLVSNILGYILSIFFFKKPKFLYTSLPIFHSFNDIFIGLRSIRFLWSLWLLAPAMYFDYLPIDKVVVKYSFISGLFASALGVMLRTLLELQREGQMFKCNKEILCGENFILGDGSCFYAIIWCVIYLVLFIRFSLKSFLGGITGGLFGIIMFSTLLTSLLRRLFIIFSFLLVFQPLVQVISFYCF